LIVRRVRLVNILSHENTEVEFPDGVVAIVGPNGAGKSSIVDSIYLALFSGPQIDIRGGRKEHIVTRGRDRGEVHVEFEVGGRRYLVSRVVDTRGTSQAALYSLEGSSRRLRAERIDSVVAEVGRVLGLSTLSGSELRKLVRSTVVALQGELTRIVDLEDSERKQLILSLLGLGYLERASRAVKEVAKEGERLRGELRARERVLEERRRELERLRREEAALAGEIARLERELASRRAELSQLEARLAAVDRCSELASKLRAAAIWARIEELRAAVARLSPLRELDLGELERLLRELDRVEGELSAVGSERARVLGELSAEFNRALGSLGDVEALYRELGSRLREVEGRVGGLEAVRELYTVYLGRFESSGRCPLCGSPIEDPGGLRGRISEELRGLEGELRRLGGERLRVAKALERVEGALGRLRGLASREEELLRTLEELRRGLAELGGRAGELCARLGVGSRGDLRSCVPALRRLAEELLRYEGELRSLEAGYGAIPKPAEGVGELIRELEAGLRELGVGLVGGSPLEYAERAIARLGELRRDAEARRARLSREVEEMGRRLENARGRLEEVRGRVGELEGWLTREEAELRELGRRVEAYELLERFAEGYLGKDGVIARELTRVAREELERRANAVLLRLGLRPISVGEGFQIGVRLAGGEVPIENASGGEKVGVSIALRLALAELTMGRTPTTLILDEPTVYLDDERRSQIFSVIGELGRTLRQVIVVTHDEDVVRIADAVIRVESNGSTSRVVSQRLGSNNRSS
jgi:exonuclease SbcC